MSKSFSNIRLFKNRNYLKMEKGNCSTCPRYPNLFAENPGPMFYRTKEGSPQQGERRISENTQKCNESPDKGKGFRDFLSTLCLRKGNMNTALCFKPLNVKQQLFDQVVGGNIYVVKILGIQFAYIISRGQKVKGFPHFTELALLTTSLCRQVIFAF